MTLRELIASLRRGPYAWPGGYTILYATTDGGTLCRACVLSEMGQVGRSTRDRAGDGWAIEAEYIHWEGPDEVCDHCMVPQPSEYEDPDALADCSREDASGCPEAAEGDQ